MALRRLRVVEDQADAAPAAAEGRMRIAIATNDLKGLNAHFGSARKFAIYEVGREDWRFVEAVAFDNVSDQTGRHAEDGDDRITPKVDALKGCTLLFVLAIGGPAAAKAVAARIHPIKVPEPQPIEQVLERVRTMLDGTPPPWLRKLLGDRQARSMDFLDEED